MKRLCVLGVFCLALFLSPVYADLAYELSSDKIKQGDTAVITVTSKKSIKGTFKIAKKTFGLYPQDRFLGASKQLMGFVAIDRRANPGSYQLSLSVQEEGGNTYAFEIPITVLDGGFRKEHIKLTKKKNNLVKGRAKLRDENRRIANALKRSESFKMFHDSFLLPVPNGRITSTFGNMRVYNGVPSWSHSGLDLGKRLGAPILASNRGKVVLVGNFGVHGKTVIIDHGWKIFTIYNHLQKIYVQHHQVVARGQRIGTMGATGVATGPHLHWGVTINGVRVNPLQWVEDPYLTF